MNLWSQLADGCEGPFFYPVAEARGETHGTKQTQLVLGEALMRIADGANDAVLQVGAAADVVEDFAGGRVEQQAVDGEVTALHVKPGFGAEAHLVGMAAV